MGIVRSVDRNGERRSKEVVLSLVVGPRRKVVDLVLTDYNKDVLSIQSNT
jgi:hypothetical protein